MTPSPWSPAELLAPRIPIDEREWVAAAMAAVWMRPLLFDRTSGAWAATMSESTCVRHRMLLSCIPGQDKRLDRTDNAAGEFDACAWL